MRNSGSELPVWCLPRVPLLVLAPSDFTLRWSQHGFYSLAPQLSGQCSSLPWSALRGCDRTVPPVVASAPHDHLDWRGYPRQRRLGMVDLPLPAILLLLVLLLLATYLGSESDTTR